MHQKYIQYVIHSLYETMTSEFFQQRNDETNEFNEAITSSFISLSGLPVFRRKEVMADRGYTNEDSSLSEESKNCNRNRKHAHPSTSGSILLDSLISAQLLKEHYLHSELAQKYLNFFETLETQIPSWELRIINGSYNVTSYTIPSIRAPIQHRGKKEDASDEEMPRPTFNKSPKPNVANQIWIYQLLRRLLFIVTTRQTRNYYIEKHQSVLKDINLRFESGKMYLVLGTPGSGKSTLLKYISNLLQVDKSHVTGGNILLNGISPTDKRYCWRNLVRYVDEIDQHQEYLTVRETFQYAFNCRRGTHRTPHFARNTTNDDIIKTLDQTEFFVNLVIEVLGLQSVADNLVGNDVTVRGISGGERKRVTIGELLCVGAPILCMDEISTGLDAATTFDICKFLALSNATAKTIRIVSLLAPSPEIAALFDELILIDKGNIIYSGPISDSLCYFESLGYSIPDRIDVADWLLSIPSKKGAIFRTKTDSLGSKELMQHLSSAEFAAAFKSSYLGRLIQDKNSEEFGAATNHIVNDTLFTDTYQIPWFRSLCLVISHEFTLWRRNRARIKARLFRQILMGLIIGTVFYNGGQNPDSGFGLLFEVLMFLAFGTSVFILPQIYDRSVVYKHLDLDFYRTIIFVVGRSIASIPAITIDVVLYGTLVFFLSGLAYNDGATLWNFLIFLFLLFIHILTTVSIFSAFTAITRDGSSTTALMNFSVLITVMFSGYAVLPAVIPSYWKWLYWINYFAWLLRALLINQYGSGKFGEAGATILFGLGFNDRDYQFTWVWFGVLFACGTILLSLILNSILLIRIRYRTARPENLDDDTDVGNVEDCKGDLPFQNANLTFTNIQYTVKSSVSNEDIMLLKGVTGYITAGKMTALMGSSGAGKTTLMDVLALRKIDGAVQGEIRLNGHIQNPMTFRRCMGYAEQFDIQSQQLTVKETIWFSAKMRLIRTSESTVLDFVEKTMKLLDLCSVQDCLVESGNGIGLSFEQKKRLGIAVEVVSNPSILFLDEPTSGLDASASDRLMRNLRRIADDGIAICATIHQPSISIFNYFDNLLLLKRGGEQVFFGEIGEESCKLIEYFESFETASKIRCNENPATWMLNTIGGGTCESERKSTDYTKAYASSRLHQECLDKISEIIVQKKEKNEIRFTTKYSTSFIYQAKAVFMRMIRIYWRSPSYNTTRLVTGALISLLFASVYASERVVLNETQMNSICNSVFLSMVFLALNAHLVVMPFFEQERNMFYRHQSSLMYSQKSFTLALFFSELPFILLVGMVFSVCFYFLLGFAAEASKFFYFYLFVTLNVAYWAFLGQLFTSILPDAVAAVGIGCLFFPIVNLFAGVFIAPQNIPNFWIWAYWAFPFHYVVEGILVSQYYGSDLQIEPVQGSSWYIAMQCTENNQCYGTPYEFIQFRFGGYFSYGHLTWNVVYFLGAITVTNALKSIALHRLRFIAK